jgi:hypothetical protein
MGVTIDNFDRLLAVLSDEDRQHAQACFDRAVEAAGRKPVDQDAMRAAFEGLADIVERAGPPAAD